MSDFPITIKTAGLMTSEHSVDFQRPIALFPTPHPHVQVQVRVVDKRQLFFPNGTLAPRGGPYNVSVVLKVRAPFFVWCVGG